jgi:hypothetical protein
MSARLVRGWSFHGFDAWILENAALRVSVIPELGGKVLEIIDKAADRDLLWHNPRIPPRRAPYRAEFDDWWCGGWDEVFPTGDVARLDGEALPYMGELWSVPWDAVAADAEEGARAISMSVAGIMAPVRFERRLELRGDEPILRVQYRLVSLAARPVPFVWGIHPALAASPTHRIDMPASGMVVGKSSGASLGAPGQAYEWPWLPDESAPGGRRDIREVRDAGAGVFGGHWAPELREGWLALTDTSTRRGLVMTFPSAIFPAAWLWLTYGGYRGHHHVILEPWTSRPMQLEDAVTAGTARTLGVGQVVDADVAFVLQVGRAAVQTVTRDGDAIIIE